MIKTEILFDTLENQPTRKTRYSLFSAASNMNPIVEVHTNYLGPSGDNTSVRQVSGSLTLGTSYTPA